MDLIIKTGFEAITYTIEFHPETLIKGKALAVSHVVRVEELRSGGKPECIRCSVIRQTSVSLTPYKVVLELDANRHITAVSCTCVAHIQHIYSLIHYINTDRSSSKTSFEQEWGRPSDAQIAKDLYAKGILVTEAFKTKVKQEKPTVVRYRLQMSDISEPCALRTYLKECNRTEGESIVRYILHDILDTVITSSLESNCVACAMNLINFSKTSQLHVGTAMHFCDENLLNFYMKKIVVTENELIEICVRTLKQSESEEWFTARNIRISASSRAHAIKVRSRKTVESLISDFCNSSELKGKAKAAVQYGITNERTARLEYEALLQVKVLCVGLLVLCSQPWLCASPDGIVIEDGCITKVLEIKCPSSCSKIPVFDTATNKVNVAYLYLSNGFIKLKRSSQYYTQCQIQLYVTGLAVCDLYVWSPKGSCLVTVYRDDEFLQAVIPLLENFYFSHFLKTLFEKQT